MRRTQQQLMTDGFAIAPLTFDGQLVVNGYGSRYAVYLFPAAILNWMWVRLKNTIDSVVILNSQLSL